MIRCLSSTVKQWHTKCCTGRNDMLLVLNCQAMTHKMPYRAQRYAACPQLSSNDTQNAVQGTMICCPQLSSNDTQIYCTWNHSLLPSVFLELCSLAFRRTWTSCHQAWFPPYTFHNQSTLYGLHGPATHCPISDRGIWYLQDEQVNKWEFIICCDITAN